MDKIEKLMHIKTDKNQHVSPDTVFEMCCKINEIIDFLNQLKGQQVELTNKQVTDFVKHTDQNRELNQIAKESEKQPEKCDCDYCKAYRFSMEKEPEKQEEWREGLDNIDLMLAMLQSIENCTDEAVRNTAKAIREELDKVSQLLSESKEKAKIEVLEKVLEKKTNYEIEREEHGYRVTLEYVLADDIKKEIKLLKERK